MEALGGAAGCLPEISKGLMRIGGEANQGGKSSVCIRRERFFPGKEAGGECESKWL